ncbi:hypothetical protein SAMN05660337_1934 [Maridesulfovibrio ferrireducens]|uniref:Uncharacterized protein n=1 Tax=Maridesulfovibrio ferrireducens TaxID=246191 RepID=A0A1G9GYW3_9BACT|nr:magnetosome protein MamC [Maridesulfovibrio ferrireducens]SDL05841.1 hypothetical protein SAMN05660337_1934 [Maridesulfovibrio ferrireducens]
MTTPATRILPIATASMAATGALISGTVTAVRGTIAVKEGKMTSREVIKAVATESAGTGLATGTGIAIVGLLGIGGLAGIIGFTAIATGTKVLWDKSIGSNFTKKIQS